MFSKKHVFVLIFCLKVFVAVFNANAQSMHPIALEHFKQGIEYLVSGDYLNTVVSINQAIRINPNSAINYVIRARAFYGLNQFDNVITDSSQAIRLDRSSSAAFLIRGNAHGQNGDIDRAIADWEAALRINPNIEEARHNIELARRQQESAAN
jgi:tetratricopeptide (TPR) repeat protein